MYFFAVLFADFEKIVHPLVALDPSSQFPGVGIDRSRGEIGRIIGIERLALSKEKQRILAKLLKNCETREEKL